MQNIAACCLSLNRAQQNIVAHVSGTEQVVENGVGCKQGLEILLEILLHHTRTRLRAAAFKTS